MSSKKKTGRPTVYNADEHPDAAEQLARMGKTIAEIAQTLRVSVTTIKNWMGEHPAFLTALTRGREEADDQVEAALYRRAVGYTFTEIKLLVVSKGKGQASVVERHQVETHVLPDVSACAWWLKNRRSKDWKDKQVVEHQGLGNLAARMAAARVRVLKQAPKP